MPVQEGDQVEIEYVGTLDNGETFDSSKQHEQNLIFKVEKDAIFDGFYEAVLGMEEEEEKEFRIEAKDAYGE